MNKTVRMYYGTYTRNKEVLIALYVFVNEPNEVVRGGEAAGAHGESEAVADECRVNEEEAGLECARHLAVCVEQNAVGVDVDSHRPSGDEGSPPPSIIFGVEMKVSKEDGEGGSEHEEEEERDKQNAVERVYAGVGPDGLEDVVELEVDGEEGEEAREGDLKNSTVCNGVRGRNFSR